MPIGRERTELDKKPTWFIFVGANFSVVLGCAVTWILLARNEGQGLVWIPTLVCNLVGLILCGLFMWFELKDIAPKIMHFQKKWLWIYIVAAIFFILSIIFNVLFFTLYLAEKYTPGESPMWPLIVYFVITAVLTLVSIGVQRYARFKIDLDVYKRKRGQMPQEKKEEKPAESKPKDDKPKASGGLVDQIDNK